MLGERIKRLRFQLNISQAALAKTAGVNPAAVSRWQHCVNDPSNSAIKLICETYNVDEQWLRTGEGSMIASAQSPSAAEDKLQTMTDNTELFKRTFIKMVEDMTPEQFIEFITGVMKMRGDM